MKFLAVWPGGFALCALLTFGGFGVRSALAQPNAGLAGDYTGAVGPLHVKLHLAVSPGGTLSGTVDSPDQNLFGLQCTDLTFNGGALSFSVPNVRGEWMGQVSADHTTLTGIWKQGSPVPLNFTRGDAAATVSNAAPVAPMMPVRTAVNPMTYSVAAAACGTMYGVSYQIGTAWKPMVMAAHLGGDSGVNFKEAIKNPFNPRGGMTAILTFKNTEANLTLNPSPTFCIQIPANFDPTIVKIGKIDVKKDHRELETCAGRCASRGRTTDDWMPDKRVQEVEIKRVSDNLVEITPKGPLPAGQYLLGGPPLIGYYDFGVKGSDNAGR